MEILGIVIIEGRGHGNVVIGVLDVSEQFTLLGPSMYGSLLRRAGYETFEATARCARVRRVARVKEF
jgi:hypothetical protein